MFYKSVTLNVVSSNIPFKLSVWPCDGIKAKTITSTQTTFCFCTYENLIKLVAEYNNVTIFKTIYLNNCRNQNILVNFCFNKSIPQAVNYITLSDSNYGLPVPIAIIKFNN